MCLRARPSGSPFRFTSGEALKIRTTFFSQMGHIDGMDIVCPALAFIDGLGGPEMVLIFVIVLVLFGGQKLPEFARGLGKSIREFKKAAAGVEEEFKRALEEDERKHATPKLAAAPVVSPDAPTDAGTDSAGPDAAVHSPVTDDDVTHGEYDHHPYSEDQTNTTDDVPAAEPGSAPVQESPEQKILPPASSIPPPAAPEKTSPPPPVAPAPPPPASYPENPS